MLGVSAFAIARQPYEPAIDTAQTPTQVRKGATMAAHATHSLAQIQKLITAYHVNDFEVRGDERT